MKVFRERQGEEGAFPRFRKNPLQQLAISIYIHYQVDNVQSLGTSNRIWTRKMDRVSFAEECLREF